MSSYEASKSLITMPRLKNAFSLSSKPILEEYKLLKKMVRNKIITFHKPTVDSSILDKNVITLEDMKNLELTKKELKDELDKLDMLPTDKTHPLLLQLLKETYNDLITRFPETEISSPPVGGRKSKKYRKLKKYKSRKYK
jgi:hypothetical protein